MKASLQNLARRLRRLLSLQDSCDPDSANGVAKTVFYLTRELAAIGNELLLVDLFTPDLDTKGVKCKTEKGNLL
jgi:hypothetical protein